MSNLKCFVFHIVKLSIFRNAQSRFNTVLKICHKLNQAKLHKELCFQTNINKGIQETLKQCHNYIFIKKNGEHGRLSLCVAKWHNLNIHVFL